MMIRAIAGYVFLDGVVEETLPRRDDQRLENFLRGFYYSLIFSLSRRKKGKEEEVAFNIIHQ